MEPENIKLYQAPQARKPDVEDFRQISSDLHLGCSEEDLQNFTKYAAKITESLSAVALLPDPAAERVRYPRTPGYRPVPEENPHNAWAWKCDIRGSPEGKLAGRMIAIKDNVAVAGVPMRNGSRIFENYVPEFDATIVTRILNAGGIIVGKTAVSDLCLEGSCLTNIDGPVRNAVDDTRIAGGSSGGSGALVAGGHVYMAIGGDQGGSIRIPASFNGIVGLKPTYGLVPYTGACSIDVTIDHLGPMTRTVHDCALLLEVIAGYDDGRDGRQFPNTPTAEYSKLINVSVEGKKVGLLKEGFDICVDEIKTIVRQAADRLTEAGMVVMETSIPEHRDGPKIWMATGGFGVYNCMVRGNGVGWSKGYYPLSMMDAAFRGYKTYPQDLPPLVKFFAMYNEYIGRLYGNRFFAKGQNLILGLTGVYDMALEEFDVLVMPTLPFAAPKIPPADCSFEEFASVSLSMCDNCMPFNSTGHPALTINAGYTAEDKLPVGLMIVGKKFDEVTVLQVARALEMILSEK
ncbi:uncharacterized protein LOC112570831 [Pomacea canaliculata]|uniref:uncharacterized protein LOC112570831 n=1 Tax=Pomacea canaliculata TaxID=400727 RepID=UPI000D7399D4|nr:uncharacterized protein LOC112570831 [Pomacea canaliculata]